MVERYDPIFFMTVIKIFFFKKTDLDWDGIEMRLFLIMAEKLNFTWTIRKPEGNYT